VTAEAVAAPFVPLGSRARWRILADLLAERGVDDVLGYDLLGDALDLHPARDLPAIQTAFRRAAAEHLVTHRQACEVVPTVGYRIVSPPEHLRLAGGLQRRSRRALAAGEARITHVDASGLDAAVAEVFMAAARAFGLQHDFMRRLDVRQRDLARAVESVTATVTRSAADVAELRDRMDRLTARLDRDDDTQT
jgi:hypothetical protein